MRLHRDVGSGIIQCPCEGWQLEFPVFTPPWMIKHELDKHYTECIVGAATKIAAAEALTTAQD